MWVPVYNFLIASALLLLCCFVASWAGASGKMRSLTRRILSLEYAVEDLEGRVLREVKIRAGKKGQAVREADQELLKWAEEQAGPNVLKDIKPTVSYKDWRFNKMKGQQ